ncbi:hypothetical protein [Croceitalea rosinachiae]|uniref:LTXXQ motif family protein n=1 Tax=Croceitalea rosinachiae TaxID=3075596 RepID=A0ABU3A9L1_9FLAO|nr:hypothetical protein [Croceitalea sp. F388]MDT0606877.1 hypothetical protein [Croceitalea sp. F388]
MKKVFIAVVLLTGLTTFAQRGERHVQKERFAKDYSVEQLATLKTKKMTLVLDLTNEQQEQVMELNLANAEFRKTRMEELKAKKEAGEAKKPTADEKFAFENARLDRQLAQQEKMKQILNDNQYQQWKKLSMHMHARGKKRMQKEGRRG